MDTWKLVRRSMLSLGLLLIAVSAVAQPQPATNEFVPSIGQAGKDVIWVPTPQSLVDGMLDIAKVTPRDYLIDLGSGDGRTVISAAKRGVRALGIEYNPDMVELSKHNAEKEGVSAMASFMKADLFESDLSKATVITMFLLPDINLQLRPKLLDLKPGTRIVSNTFTMGEWTADQKYLAEKDCTTYCTAYLWIVPAKVAGAWRLAQGELTLKQEFQMLTGTLRYGHDSTTLMNGRMNGDRISFTAGSAQYSGRVYGSTMEGIVKTGSSTAKWSATRAGKVAAN